jgi:hypothetical protein
MALEACVTFQPSTLLVRTPFLSRWISPGEAPFCAGHRRPVCPGVIQRHVLFDRADKQCCSKSAPWRYLC